MNLNYFIRILKIVMSYYKKYIGETLNKRYLNLILSKFLLK